MKFSSKIFFIALALASVFFVTISSARADDTPVVLHETDNGKTITVNRGQSIQFSFTENNTAKSTWMYGDIFYELNNSILSSSGAKSVYDSTQTVVTATHYSLFASYAGNDLIYFCQQDQNGNYTNPLIFSVIVVDPNAR